jgi:hypothetical protein
VWFRLSSLAGHEIRVLTQLLERPIEATNELLKTCATSPCTRHNFIETWADKASIGTREKQRNAQTVSGHAVSVALGDSFNDAMQAQSSEVVRQSPRSHFAWVDTQQVSQRLSEISSPHSMGLKTEADQDAE